MKYRSALDYVKIDIANTYGHGLNKKSFAKRIAWVNSIKDLHTKTNKADSPAQYLAAVYALEDALAGIPSGHLIEFDAGASGISILGVLTGCHITANNTGITGNKPMDMYAECTKEMGIEGYNRADIKSAQMTWFYGSKREPKNIFGDDTEELFAFYEAQEAVAPGACYMMRELLESWQPYALEHSHTLPDGFHSRVPVLQKFKSKIEIDELDGTTLTYIYEDNVGTEKGLAVAANATHAVDSFLVREVCRRCNYDVEYLQNILRILKENETKETINNKENNPYIEVIAREHQFISLRGVEFITKKTVLDYTLAYRRELSDLIIETLRHKSFPVLTIHDAYKSLPGNVHTMRNIYRGVLAELADSRVGEQIIQELRDDPSYVLDKFSDDLGNEIIQGEYAIN